MMCSFVKYLEPWCGNHSQKAIHQTAFVVYKAQESTKLFTTLLGNKQRFFKKMERLFGETIDALNE